jgi:hypothetical protein
MVGRKPMVSALLHFSRDQAVPVKQQPQEERAFPFLQHGYPQEAKNDFLPSSDA